ncbi:hypothetical protein MPER_02435 [Moniliophthora perniciosa FA553]|nr:hypothetical protein MPER_02435 [Moniliophthora perniciosa FA553]
MIRVRKWTLQLIHHLQRIHQIARDMIQAAWKHDKLINVQLEGWVARPSSLLKRQTNSYDCGVWVLTMIAAALRGFDIGEVKEDNIDQIRQFLYRLVLSLEPYSEDSNREYQFTGSVL